MKELLADKKHVYHLYEYAIMENEDGTYEYLAWDSKSGNLSWIRGEAKILGDVLALTSITSDGEEQTLKTTEEVQKELERFPEWGDKTKFYCVILGQNASLVHYCETGEPLKQGTEDYKTLQQTFKNHGVIFR
jgi:hypothetical protein